MNQPARSPNLDAQRAAMSRLSFLVGKWQGEARIYSMPGEPLVLTQTEHAQYKLDGLLLLIEGIGKRKTDGLPTLQALGIISFDDGGGSYHMRAFNDGRFLETDVVLSNNGRSLTWGFTLENIRTNSALRINDKGEWTEDHKIAIGPEPPRTLMQLAVARQE